MLKTRTIAVIIILVLTTSLTYSFVGEGSAGSEPTCTTCEDENEDNDDEGWTVQLQQPEEQEFEREESPAEINVDGLIESENEYENSYYGVCDGDCNTQDTDEFDWVKFHDHEEGNLVEDWSYDESTGDVDGQLEYDYSGEYTACIHGDDGETGGRDCNTFQVDIESESPTDNEIQRNEEACTPGFDHDGDNLQGPEDPGCIQPFYRDLSEFDIYDENANWIFSNGNNDMQTGPGIFNTGSLRNNTGQITEDRIFSNERIDDNTLRVYYVDDAQSAEDGEVETEEQVFGGGWLTYEDFTLENGKVTQGEREDLNEFNSPLVLPSRLYPKSPSTAPIVLHMQPLRTGAYLRSISRWSSSTSGSISTQSLQSASEVPST